MSLRELDKPARDLLRLASVLAAAVVEVLLTKCHRSLISGRMRR